MERVIQSRLNFETWRKSWDKNPWYRHLENCK